MNNGFSLMESILALLIVSICIQILIGCICSISNQEERILNEKIEKKWFYSDLNFTGLIDLFGCFLIMCMPDSDFI